MWQTNSSLNQTILALTFVAEIFFKLVQSTHHNQPLPWLVLLQSWKKWVLQITPRPNISFRNSEFIFP